MSLALSNGDDVMQYRQRSSRKSTVKPGDELVSGFVRLHVLHHATKEPVVGLWMIEELGHHGYKLSPGTMYPLLHGMERKGYLRSTNKKEGRKTWREYRATTAGRRALEIAKKRLRELFHELIEEEERPT